MVGLGNPGREYAGTRHNVGFRIVEHFARAHAAPPPVARFGGSFTQLRVESASSCEGQLREMATLLPETFMNRSGASVTEAVRELALDDLASQLVVVYDDLDLPFGRLRVRPTGGAGGHRGVADIIECLGTRDFARIRFGIGRPVAGEETIDFVLSHFSDDENAVLPELLDEAGRAIDLLLEEGSIAAMNRFNRMPDADGEDLRG